MSEDDRRRLPAGRPPWDVWNATRIGLLTGGLLGVLGVTLVGSNDYWLALIVAAIGGLVGYLTERRKIDHEIDRAI